MTGGFSVSLQTPLTNQKAVNAKLPSPFLFWHLRDLIGTVTPTPDARHQNQPRTSSGATPRPLFCLLHAHVEQSFYIIILPCDFR